VLVELGDQTVTALTDDSDRARALNAIYADSRDQVLSDFPWAFAVTRATLAQIAGSPVWGFTRWYQLPTDTIRVLETQEPTAPWRREADRILTDLSSMAIKYIARITDPVKFSPGFVRALVAYLKWRLPITITGSLNKQIQYGAEYRATIAQVRGSDEEFKGLEQWAWPQEQSFDIYSPLRDVR